MNARRTVIIVAPAIMVLVAVLLASMEAIAEKDWYPCTKCHLRVRMSGYSRASSFHNIDLSVGAHAGLICANCHVAPGMDELVGGAKVLYYYEGRYRELNVVCMQCHKRVYSDYLALVHGNKTIVCEGGENVLVKGYKGVGYWLHICPEYEFKAIPARGCVECHNPHDPVYKPIAPLPPPSRRPPAPDETPIAYTTLAVLISSLALMVLPAIIEGRRRG